MTRPAIYIQHLDDETEETQDAFDRLHPVIGGEPRDEYRVGVALEEGYRTERVGSLEEAGPVIDTLLEETGLDYDRPETLEDILIEKRYWQD